MEMEYETHEMWAAALGGWKALRGNAECSDSVIYIYYFIRWMKSLCDNIYRSDLLYAYAFFIAFT